jgi:hypothetical protein
MKLVDYFVIIALWFMYTVSGISAVMYGLYAVAGFLNNQGVFVFTDAHVSVITYALLFAMTSGSCRATRISLTAVTEAHKPVQPQTSTG